MLSVLYFSPSVSSSDIEIESIRSVVEVLETELNANISTVPTWSSLMTLLHEQTLTEMLIVFRLDYLERTHLLLDEVLSMLSTLTKFVAETKKIKIAVVVPKPCDQSTIAKLKRNGVAGIIPGMRFFDPKHSIEAYTQLTQGQDHWPSIAIDNRQISARNEIGLTKRQYEIFTLVAKRGLSNKKVAEQLSISEATVKVHVGTILKRFGLKNRTQLALANSTGVFL